MDGGEQGKPKGGVRWSGAAETVEDLHSTIIIRTRLLGTSDGCKDVGFLPFCIVQSSGAVLL